MFAHKHLASVSANWSLYTICTNAYVLIRVAVYLPVYDMISMANDKVSCAKRNPQHLLYGQ